MGATTAAAVQGMLCCRAAMLVVCARVREKKKVFICYGKRRYLAGERNTKIIAILRYSILIQNRESGNTQNARSSKKIGKIEIQNRKRDLDLQYCLIHTQLEGMSFGQKSISRPTYFFFSNNIMRTWDYGIT